MQLTTFKAQKDSKDSREHASKTDTENKKLLDKVIFVFFAHKK